MLLDNNFRLKVILFLFVFLIYGNTLRHDYVWDDSIVITENPQIQKGIKGIPDLFIKSNSDYKYDKYGYRPVTLTSFAIEVSFFGLSAHAQHFFNVFYFGVLCIVLYNVIRKLFQQYSSTVSFII